MSENNKNLAEWLFELATTPVEDRLRHMKSITMRGHTPRKLKGPQGTWDTSSWQTRVNGLEAEISFRDMEEVNAFFQSLANAMLTKKGLQETPTVVAQIDKELDEAVAGAVRVDETYNGEPRTRPIVILLRGEPANILDEVMYAHQINYHVDGQPCSYFPEQYEDRGSAR